MLAIATSEFGCASGDVACYCSHENFGYGIRDCSKEACGEEVANQAISYGLNYCSG